MTPLPKILVFAGSAREASYNKQLARLAASLLPQYGVEATFIDLADYPLPLYDGDLEEKSGLPENAKKLKALFLSHHGLVIASPEYNSSFSALLKNTLDWVSRPESEDEPSLACYEGKVATLLAASPGAFGGLRGLVPLRLMLGNIKVLVMPQPHAIPKAYQAFNEQGELNDPASLAILKNVLSAHAETVKKLNPSN